ncbi:MAG: PL29 family lyase N-terminal domain-containing protein [Candidatus Cryptobacteroides sp.]
MKINKYTSFFAAAALLLASVSCTDLSSLENRLDNLESRVKAIESQLPALNANIDALAKLAGGATINSVELKDGVYTITLSNGETITLTQGSVGVANAPVMSIDKEGYWMVDYGSGPEYVLRDGEKVKSTGENGVTPLFGVDAEGYWTVSYDGGATYTRVSGADGQPVAAIPSEGADEYFEDVKVENGNLVVTMKNGDTLVIPVLPDFLFAIEADGLQTLQAGQTYIYNVTSKGVANAAIVSKPSTVEATLNDNSLTVRALGGETKATADSRTDIAILAVSKDGFAAIAKLQVKVEGIVVPDTKPDVTLAAGEATTTSLTFTVALDNAESYKYILTSGEAPTASEVVENGVESSEATLTVADLTPDTEYTLYVVALGEKENSVMRSVASKTVALNPEAVVTFNSANSFSASFTVTLTDATAYKYLVVKEGEAPTLEQLTEEGTEETLVVEGLEANTTYTLYLAAVNGSYAGDIVPTGFTTPDYANIYERYVGGQDITFGDITINKDTHGKATLITAESENKVLESVGVYFIDPAVEDASIKGDAEKLVIASLTDERVKVRRAGQLGFNATAEKDFLILANVTYVTGMTSGNVIGGKGDGELENIAFYNVGIEVPKDMNMLYNGGKNILNIYLEKCDIKLHEGSAEKNLFQFNTSHTFESVVFKNNIVWSCDGDRTNFRFIAGQSTTITSLEISNNTIAGVYCKAAYGYVSAKNITNGTVKLNLFLIENYVTNLVDDTGKSFNTGIIWLPSGTDDSHLNMPSNLAYYGGSTLPSSRLKPSYYTSSGQMYPKTSSENPVPEPDYVNGVFTQAGDFTSFGAKR